jgi:hypothetical protein
VGFGINNPPGPNAYVPAYPGTVGAFSTNLNIMASPAAVGTTLLDAANPQDGFAERDAIALAFIAGGTVVDGTNPTLSGQPHTTDDGPYTVPAATTLGENLYLQNEMLNGTISATPTGTSPVTAQPVSLYSLNVPNPITAGQFDSNKKFDVAAVDVLGKFQGNPDYYTFQGSAGDRMNIDVTSGGQTRLMNAGNWVDPVVYLYDNTTGKLIAWNDDQIEGPDSSILDFTLPETGSYTIEVDSFQHATGQTAKVVPGDYELFMYRTVNYNVAAGNDTLVAGSGNDTLIGGTGNTTFVLGANATGNNTLVGGVGNNTLQATAATSFGLTNSQLTGIGNGTDSLSNIQNANLTDTLGGQTFTISLWTGTGNFSDVAVSGDTVTATKNTNFTLTDTSLQTTDGMNLALANIHVANLTGVGGNDTFDLTGWTGSGNFNGQGGGNTLIGPNLSNTWNVTAANGGNINGKDSFSSMQNLVGGAQSDTFKFYNGGSVATSIDGKGGTNTLDYSNYVGAVTVDLPLLAASLVNGAVGNFAASPGNSIANIQNVTGSQGTDILVGDNNANVLAVGPTNPGRSLLIGGTGADTLIGGGPDDILAAGTTEGTTANYELNLPALNALMAEWTSSDSYKNRVNAILNTSQANLNMLNGVPIVLAPNSNKPNTGTIVDNTTANSIVGGTGPGLDLIYYDVSLTTVTNTLSSEKFVNLQGTRATNLSTENGGIAYTPAQVRTAYTVNNLGYDGSGQTIAVVEAYNDPNIFQAVDAFDTQFGLTGSGPNLYSQYGPAASFLTVLGETGQPGTALPAVDPTGGWEAEEALDVEWAHAMAPGAQIIVVEANSQSLADLMASVATAAQQPGVSVVSMSWGFPEGQAVLAQDEALYDADLTTPAGHTPVTFVASTGDYGTNDPEYPSFSPNVVAVGGTSLYLNADNSYKNETGWGYFSSQFNAFIGSGGGASLYEPQPAYQAGVQSTGFRTTPDVSFVADPGTGAWIADPYNLPADNPWEVVGGTSLSAPAWAGLMALADQGRVATGEATLSSNGGVSAQQGLYHLSAADFNEITSGTNGGYTATAGYNLVTGLGTPVASRLVPDLIAFQQSSPVNATVQAAGGASGSGGATADSFNVFNALSLRSQDAGSWSPLLTVRSDAPTVTTRGPSHTADVGHGADSAPAAAYTGLPAATVLRTPAPADPSLAGEVGGGPRFLRTGGDGTLVVGASVAGSSVLLVNTGVLAGYDGSAGKRAGMPCAHLEGTSGGDVLVGGDGSDLVLGGDGKDILVGGFSPGRERAVDGPASRGEPAPEAWDVHARALQAALDDWTSGQTGWGRSSASDPGDGGDVSDDLEGGAGDAGSP